MSAAARTVFLDFDGTIAHHGIVTRASAEAIRAARQRGHRVLLCTGRPRSGIPAEAAAIGWDGLVCSAGAYVEIDGEVLRDEHFPAELAERAIQVLDRHGAIFTIEGTRANLIRERDAQRLSGGLVRAGVDPAYATGLGITPAARIEGAPFNKITCFAANAEVPEMAAEIGPEVASVSLSLIGFPGGGEIFLAGINKAGGAKIAAERLGAAQADIIAVGDGHNDLELLAYAGLAVAIQGSPDAVLALADRTAPGPTEDGLVQLFEELNLTA